jgi:hypothetical protein
MKLKSTWGRELTGKILYVSPFTRAVSCRPAEHCPRTFGIVGSIPIRDMNS